MAHRSQPVRIPVSLAFEKNSDFYQDFILDLKTNRQLSTLIVDLLEAYYKNADIKAIFDVAISSDSSYSAVMDQLERVKLEHSKNVMTTSVLHQHTRSSIEEVESALSEDEPSAESTGSPLLLETVVQPATQSTQDAQSDGVLTRLSALEESIPAFGKKLDDLMSLLSHQATVAQPSPSSSSPVTSPTSTQSSKPTSGISPPKSNSPESKTVTNSGVNNTTGDVSPPTSPSSGNNSSPVPDDEPDTGGIIIASDDDEEEVTSTPQPVTVPPEDENKKPPSFGRALGSIKKSK